MILSRLKNDGKPLLKLNDLQLSMKAQVEMKLKTKEYVFEEVSCEICGANDFEKIGDKDRYGLHYQTNICNQCGLVYTNPRMDQKSYNSFYNLEYRKLYVGTETATELFFNRQRRSGKKIHDFLVTHAGMANKGLSILEIGCGAGGILDHFRTNEHQIEGLDLGAEYVQYGIEKHGLNLKTGMLKDLDREKKRDVIIYSHVMEHILDLNDELELIKELSHPGTLIYIEVPGIKNIHQNYEMDLLRYFQNAHTFHFSLASLTNLFSKNGFELIKGNEHVMAVFKLTNEKSDVKNDFAAVKNYILETDKKRKSYPYTLNGLKKQVKKMGLKTLDFVGLRSVIRKMKNA